MKYAKSDSSTFSFLSFFRNRPAVHAFLSCESVAQQPENPPSALTVTVNENEKKPVNTPHRDFRACRRRVTTKKNAKYSGKAVRSDGVVFSVKCCSGNCRQLFESKSAMLHHVSSYHAKRIKKKFECYLCKAIFLTKQLLHIHTSSSHLPRVRYQCSIRACSKVFTQKCNLTKHISANHPNTRLPPQLKGEVFRQHILRSMHGSSHRCAKCKIQFATKKSLQCHKYLKHRRQSVFKCPVSSCSRIYSSNESFRAHMKVEHTKKAQYKCPKCPKRYFNDIVLLKHWTEEHAK